MPPANENSVFGFSGKFNCGFLGKDDDSCCRTALGSFGVTQALDTAGHKPKHTSKWDCLR